MAGPWEKYGTPWEKYKKPSVPVAQDAPSDTVTDYLKRLPETVLTQGVQGASFGLLDEPISGLSAGMAYGYEKAREALGGPKARNVGELSRLAYDDSQRRIKSQQEQDPGTSFLAQLGGGIATGSAFGATKAGAAAGDFLRSGNLPWRMAKGAASGAASGGLYGFGTAEEGNRGKGAANGAMVGGAFGAAVPAAIDAAKGLATMGRGVVARNADKLDNALGEIKSGSRSLYEQARNSGVVLNKNRGVSIANKIQSEVSDQMGKMHPRLHGDTMAIMDEMKVAAQEAPLDLQTLEQYRKLFRGIANKNTLSNKEDSAAAMKAIDALDDQIDNLKSIDIVGGKKDAFDLLTKARGEWAKGKKFETISDIVQKSDGDANYLRRELRKILDNPRKGSGFTDEERTALEAASGLSGAQGILKVLGKFGFDAGNSRIGAGVGALVGSGAASVAAGGTGAIAAPVIGTAARYADKFLARGKAEELLRVIEGAARPASKAISTGAPTIGGANMLVGASKPKVTVHPSEGVYGQPPEVNLPEKIGPQSDAGPWSKYKTETMTAQGGKTINMGALLPKIAKAESGGDPNARAATSSASGLYQFTDGTWKNMVMKYGKQHGITVADKNNPDAQRVMVSYLARDNAQSLRDTFKREPSDADVYLAHVFGADGAKRVLKNLGKNVPATNIFSREVVRANRPLFFTNGRPRTADELYSVISRKV